MSRQFTDTTEIFSIDSGDVILAGGKRYVVTGHERERRFGIDDPKFWVKRAVETGTSTRKIIKLSYFESFETSIGGVKILCFRNPEKEADILKLVKGHGDFMQGESFYDEKKNNIRVLDIVRGQNLFTYIGSLSLDHKTYFFNVLPAILRKLVRAFEAIRYLHLNNFRHGDIRNDHIIIEQNTGKYIWIDFDYDFETTENPFGLDIFGAGNILLYAVGKGFHNLHSICEDRSTYGDLRDNLSPGDFSLLDKWRFMNLRKLYPYIPGILNDILMHFSKETDIYYEQMEEIIDDLNRYIDLGSSLKGDL